MIRFVIYSISQCGRLMPSMRHTVLLLNVLTVMVVPHHYNCAVLQPNPICHVQHIILVATLNVSGISVPTTLKVQSFSFPCSGTPSSSTFPFPFSTPLLPDCVPVPSIHFLFLFYSVSPLSNAIFLSHPIRQPRCPLYTPLCKVTMPPNKFPNVG